MQREYFGVGMISSLNEIIKELKAQRLFIVTGKQSYMLSGAAQLLEQHSDGCHIEVFDSFSVNPKLEEAIDGVERINGFNPDCIVAVGGGSVMDMGKLVAALHGQRSEDFTAIVKHSAVTGKNTPLVAIPTTAGSGSEATRFAVVYVDGVKYSLMHDTVLPDYAIIDPSLLYNMPAHQVAVSGMDALCQAVESYWSVNANTESRELSRRAISILHSNIHQAVLSTAEKARDALAYGANLSGKAINITQTTAPHAISYTLTSEYGVPHGHAVALLLGKFFTINSIFSHTITDADRRERHERTLGEIYEMFSCSDGESCAENWYQMMREIGLKTDLSELGVRSETDWQRIVDSVNYQRLKNHPVHISREILWSLYTMYCGSQ